MKHTIISLLLGCHRWSLRLYPAAFRAEFGAEMEAVFATAVQEAAEEGPGALAAICLKETADFPANLVDAYRQVPFYPEVVVMKREASWNVLPAWVGLNLLSIPAAIVMAMAMVVLIDRTADSLLHFDGQAAASIPRAVLYISMLILASAVMQWLLLRRYLENAAVWIPLTAVGWLAGILLIYLVQPYASNSSIEWLPLALPVLGALVGGAQWLYLRRVIDHAGYWVLASTVGYGVIGIVTFEPFNSMLESVVFFFLTPFVTTGLTLVLLLRLNVRTAEGEPALPAAERMPGEQQTIWPRRLALALLAGLLLVALFFAGIWVYAAGQITLAKAEGIYATPEEGMEQNIIQNAGEYPVERVEILSYYDARINNNDGSQPRVRWVRAWVFADQRPNGKPTPRGYGRGAYFLRVEEGWVHLSEDDFSEFVGWVMELYGMEGA